MGENPLKPVGLLRSQEREKDITIRLYQAIDKELTSFVEHYWILRWDFQERGEYVSETLPHPSVHLFVEDGQAQVMGVTPDRFSTTLKGKGFVFGIKFRPGAFYPFIKRSISCLTGQTIRAANIWGQDAEKFAEEIRGMEWHGDLNIIHYSELFLLRHLPEKDNHIPRVQSILDRIMTDRGTVSVEVLAEEIGYSVRALQKLFNKYVGVSPKWVIKRYRLLEVAEKLAVGPPCSWAQFAEELGYYDQSHFMKDFRSIIGCTPEQYVRRGLNHPFS